MQRPIFVANWKMYNGPAAARAYMAAFAARWTPHTDRTVVFCPPAISISAVVGSLGGRHDIGVGVQNIWTEDKGAFTGETSALMAYDAGARYALVGHSERRHVFGESDEVQGAKLQAALRNGLTPILCVGELIAEREGGTTDDVITRQLRAGLAGVDKRSIAGIAIAYEPVWAIGTGKTASPADAAAAHGVLRSSLASAFGDAAASVPILYGGSVNVGNVASLLAAPDVDGVLVGGASLDVEGWVAICDT